ncbi:GntR family transcriptional regulator [Natronohydrobacter thiooxidans]|uniref:GntR family transcriptional regulator n=1 Tax=Natronohydrobacter thiooxidans TaxID=87172 RepID=UPI0008FF24F9|nr:GntR family transcriptional regulator [Natronohydrobacter thiooxidans]
MDGSFSPAVNTIYDTLRDRIIALDLMPGAPLSPAQIRQQFATSATPVRDALRALQEEGLVEIKPQSATRVSRIDLSQAVQMHFLRSTLEQAIIAQIASSAAARVHPELASIVDLQRECVQQSELAGFRRLDFRFHETLFRVTNRMALHRLVRRESGHIDRIRSLHLPRADKAEQIISDHAAIVDALRAQDPEQARAAMAQHLSHSVALGPELKAEFPGLFVA